LLDPPDPEARPFSVEHSSHDTIPSASFHEPGELDPLLPDPHSPASDADSENGRANRPPRIPRI